MKVRLTNSILAMLCLFFCPASFCQSTTKVARWLSDTTYPEVGKPMPDFVLKNIAYYPKKEATLKDFRGKWLILDYWNKYCGACVAAFPHNSKLQEELGDKVQVMMVGTNSLIVPS